MKRLRPSWRRLWADDALGAYRDRIALHLTIFSALLLLPFTITHLAAGRLWLGGLILLAQAVMVVNGQALRRNRRAPVPFWVMLLAFNSAIVAAILVQGVNSVFWAFPALFICYFLLPRKQAHAISLLLMLAVSLAALMAGGPGSAVRALAAMCLTLTMINVVLNVIGELQLALVEQTITDPLTGAYNRRHFDVQLAQMQSPTQPSRQAASAGRAAGAESGAARRTANVMLAIDIDHFKAVNDRHGHAMGDAVLKAVVALLNQRRRQSDLLFRIGGEEFVLLLPRTLLADAQQVAEDLRQRFEACELVPGVRITVSMGLSAQLPGLATAPWLAAADAALYEAKRGGRNRVVMAPLPA